MEKSVGRNTLIRIIVIAVLLLLGIGVAGFSYYYPDFFAKNGQDAAPHLQTGGTSSVFFMMDYWKTRYRLDKGIEVDYDSSGSTSGVTKMIDHKYAIGFTHAPMTEEQRKKAQEAGGEVVHIPVVICAVVPVYHLKALANDEPLNFTGEVLAKIFLGDIKKWNDEAIQKLNPKVKDKLKLLDEEIKVVHREDSSGTTYIFAEYLFATSKDWQEKMKKPKSELDWKAGVGKERNIGVARYVKETEYAIGYVELLHTHVDGEHLQYGAVHVQDPKKDIYIHAEPKNMTAAAKSLSAGDLKDDLTFDLTNRPGDESYPICGAIWAVCYRDQPAATHKMVVDFLHWVTHEGQGSTAERTYAPLPKEFTERVEEKLKTIKSAP